MPAKTSSQVGIQTTDQAVKYTVPFWLERAAFVLLHDHHHHHHHIHHHHLIIVTATTTPKSPSSVPSSFFLSSLMVKSSRCLRKFRVTLIRICSVQINFGKLCEHSRCNLEPDNLQPFQQISRSRIPESPTRREEWKWWQNGQNRKTKELNSTEKSRKLSQKKITLAANSGLRHLSIQTHHRKSWAWKRKHGYSTRFR